MNILKNLSDRERRLLVPAIVVTAFLSILLLVDIPLYKKGMDMRRKAVEEEKRLKSVISMGQEYLSKKNEVEDIRDRAFKGDGISLTGVDAVVSKAGLKKKLSSIKPTTTPVTDGMRMIKTDLYFEKVALNEIARLFAMMEADGHPLKVVNASLKATYENPSLFNATLIVNTVEKD